MSDTALRDSLIRMGHDIARQFSHLTREEAVEEVSAHLLKFWEPRMRAEVRQSVADDDGDIDPILAEAVRTWPDEEDTQADRHEPSGG